MRRSMTHRRPTPEEARRLNAPPHAELLESDQKRCDFCHKPAPSVAAWHVPQMELLIYRPDGKPGHRVSFQSGVWGACEDCHEAAERKDADALWAIYRKNGPLSSGDSAYAWRCEELKARALWAKVFELRQGPVPPDSWPEFAEPFTDLRQMPWSHIIEVFLPQPPVDAQRRDWRG
jgi:hypothetical protein